MTVTDLSALPDPMRVGVRDAPLDVAVHEHASRCLDADGTAAMRSDFEAVGIQVHVDDDRWGDHRL